MKKKIKIILIICIVLGILSILLGILLLNSDSKEKPKEDNPPVEEEPGEGSDDEFGDDKEEPGIIFSSTEVRKVDGIEISNVKYERRESDYVLTFDVVNNSNKNYSRLDIVFKIYEGAHFYLYSFDFSLGAFKKGETKSFEYSFSMDYTMMNDFDFVIV